MKIVHTSWISPEMSVMSLIWNLFAVPPHSAILFKSFQFQVDTWVLIFNEVTWAWYSQVTDKSTLSTAYLTHWGRVTHICVSKLTITGPDNGLSPGRRQDIIGTNAGILLIRTLGTNFSEISIKINTFSLTKMHLAMSSGRRQPSCLGLDVLSENSIEAPHYWPLWGDDRLTPLTKGP